MLPMLVDEAMAQTFVFYQDGSLFRGLKFRQRLLKLVRHFDSRSRSKAFEFGCRLSSQWFTVVTVSPQGYGVWVDLHATVACSGMKLLGPDLPNDVRRNTDNTEPGRGNVTRPWKRLNQPSHWGFDEPPKYSSERTEDEGFDEIKV